MSVTEHTPEQVDTRAKGDLVAIGGAFALIAVAAVVGTLLIQARVGINIFAPPLFGWIRPHLGPGTPFAILIGIAGIVYGPRIAASWPWRRLLIMSWVTALAWTMALALVDGWSGGFASRLEGPHEYLHDLDRIASVPAFLATFSGHIVDGQPGKWSTHVAGHPPGVTLIFYLLGRIGLSGGAWAGAFVVLVGCLAAIMVPVTVRALGAPEAARRILPFTVFLPAAIWVGVSADGMFAGVAATGLALAVIGATSNHRGWPVFALAGGLLLGLLLYLSYGMVLFGIVVLAAAGCTIWSSGPRVLTRWLVVAAGCLAVVIMFTGAGFSWFEGLRMLQIRYYQGIAARRPYEYFVWANLAAFAICAGPAIGTGLRRLNERGPAMVLALAGLLAVLVADLSALSKAETERIWLPFAFVVACAYATLPRRPARRAMIISVVTALVVDHLIWTTW